MPVRSRKDPTQQQRLEAFASRLDKLMLQRGWSGQEMADAASKHVPASHVDKKTGKRFQLGRHLISAYLRAANEPSEANLSYIAKALGVRPSELLPPAPGEDEAPQYAQLMSTADGKMRLVIDAEINDEDGLKLLRDIREAITRTVTGAESGSVKIATKRSATR